MYAIWKLDDPCETASVGGTFVENGVTFIKLKDNNCWTKSSRDVALWNGAAALCSSGTNLPSAQDFDTLLTAYGGKRYSGHGAPYGWQDSDSDLYNATGWSGNHWSSTEYASNTTYAWLLSVKSYVSSVQYMGAKNSAMNVVCIRS